MRLLLVASLACAALFAAAPALAQPPEVAVQTEAISSAPVPRDAVTDVPVLIRATAREVRTSAADPLFDPENLYLAVDVWRGPAGAKQPPGAPVRRTLSTA